MSSNSDPEQVRDADSGDYARFPIRRREECLLLYGPIPQQSSKSSQDGDNKPLDVYDIIAHSSASKTTTHCISLFRSCDVKEAEERFTIYHRTITLFLEVKPDLFSVSSLQKLCDTIRTNKDWSVCHIAVSLDILEVLNHSHFQAELELETEDGLTPLLLAAKAGSKHITQAVLAAGARLDKSDKLGLNCFHYAATSSSTLVEILANSKQASEGDVLVRLLNEHTKEGLTPLHLACNKEKQDIVVTLLCSGADINTMGIKEADMENKALSSSTNFREILKLYPNQLSVKDIKYGGTPLHWAMDKPFLEAILEMGCNISAKDFKGNTALHTMTKYKRLPCIVSLLSHGAKVEDRDADGNTALHLAALSGHVPSVQALLVFDADFSLTNNAGDRAWTIILQTFQSKIYNNLDKERNALLYILHSLGDRGPNSLEKGSKNDFEWKPTGQENIINKRSRHQLDKFLDESGLNVKEIRSEDLRILSLDGGGIRGLVLVKLLSALQKVSKVPITEMFDWMGGTSTGGILTLALACGKSPQECQGLYFRLKDKVFVGKRPYDVTPLEVFLKKELSETMTMMNLPKSPKVSVTGVIADRHPADLHLFTNYQRPADILGLKDDLPPTLSPAKKPDQQELWQAARCSGAAPTYFRAAGRFIDGGLISNNPTQDLLTEVYELNMALRAVGREKEARNIGIVVSLGTGEPPLEKVDSVDLFRPDSIMNLPALVFGASAMGRLLIDQACSASNRVVDRARAWCGMAHIAYIRFSPQLDLDVRLDETSDEILVNMIYLTQVYMYENRHKLETLVGQLVSNKMEV